MTAYDHKATKERAIEVSKSKYKGTSLEGEMILIAAYLDRDRQLWELRERAWTVVDTAGEDDSLWPEMRKLRKLLEMER